MFRRAVAAEPHSLRIRTDELRTVREAMRDLGSLLTEQRAEVAHRLADGAQLVGADAYGGRIACHETGT